MGYTYSTYGEVRIASWWRHLKEREKLGRHKQTQEDNIKINPKETE